MGRPIQQRTRAQCIFFGVGTWRDVEILTKQQEIREKKNYNKQLIVRYNNEMKEGK